MTMGGVGLNKETFGKIIGNYFNFGFFPALIFVAPFCDSYNRKCIIGFSAICWGLCMMYTSRITVIEEMYALTVVEGFFTATVESVIYNIIGDFFDKKHRIRAYIAFTFLSLLTYPILYLVPNIIKGFGWRQAWLIIGALPTFLGLLTLLTIKDPVKPQVLA